MFHVKHPLIDTNHSKNTELIENFNPTSSLRIASYKIKLQCNSNN